MITTLKNRLSRLEGQQAPPVEVETSFTPALRLLRLLLAVHLGDLRLGEDMAAGEARALGFETAAEMRATMVVERTAFIGWGSRHNEAMARMLEPHGGGSGTGTALNEEMLQALLATLPEPLRADPAANPSPAVLRDAVEWMSL